MFEILCSGVSLGHYVPGLLIRDRLRRLGQEARVLVYESLLDAARCERIERTRQLYHASVAFARTAQRIARQLAPQAQEALGAQQIERWAQSPPKRLIVLSAYWLSLLSRAVEAGAVDAHTIDLCHIDSTLSPVWQASSNYPSFRHTWLCSAHEGSVFYRIPIGDDSTSAVRDARVVVHGGGWGIGDYREAVPQLLSAGLGVDLVAYADDDLADPIGGVRYLRIDPRWQPWDCDELGDPYYPPLQIIERGKLAAGAASNGHGHTLFDFIANAAAIVSKPGGATLVDSLAGATPVVFVTPFGQHEADNASLWTSLGFGTSLERWCAEGMTFSAIDLLRANLETARPRIPCYPDAVA